MQQLIVQWHRTRYTLDAKVPEDDLRVLFKTVGIDLRISQGQDINEFSPRDDEDFDKLEERFDPKGNAPQIGHLFISDQPPASRPSVLGEVCGRTHGMAVVYARKLGSNMVANSMLAVCAHEIGHMCNLTHGLARKSSFDSIMTQSKLRDDDPSHAWKKARKEADNAGVSSDLWPGANPACLPFNHACRSNLAYPIAQWGPWTNSFDGANSGDREDRTRIPALQMLLHPASTQCRVGEAISFDIELFNNARKRTIQVPLNLDCGFGHLHITIISGTGTRIYAPRKFSCSNELIAIAPGNSAFFPVSLATDRHGCLIRAPGLYEILVELHGASGKKPTGLAGTFRIDASPAAETASPARAPSRWIPGARQVPTAPKPPFSPWSLRKNGSPKLPRATLHSSILLLADAMPEAALPDFVRKMERQFPAKEDATLHHHLNYRLRLTESAK